MLIFAYYLLKVLICSAIMYGYYIVALRNKRFHQYNRWYLLSAVILSFLVPLIKIEFWKETVQPSAVMKVVTIVSDADVYVAKNTLSFWSWDNVALIVFSFISFIFLLSVIVALIKIFLLIKNHPKKFLNKICFVFSNTPGTPFSFFQYIFWNTGIDVNSDAGKHILKHELAHVEEKHSNDKLFINFALVIGWCNPFLWLIRKELNLVHEFIADQKAISNGDTQAFAEMLIKTSYPFHSFLLVNSFFHSPIKRRIIMLTTSKLSSYTYLRRLMILPLLLIVTILFAFKVKEKIDSTNNKALSVSVNEDYTKRFADEAAEIPDHNEYEDKITAAKNLQDTVLKKDKAVVEIPQEAGIKITDPSGVLIELPKNELRPNAIYRDSFRFKYSDVLIVLDGELMTYVELGEKNIQGEQIKQIDVLKGESAIHKYGGKGQFGVIEITTISPKSITQKVKPENTDREWENAALENKKPQTLQRQNRQIDLKDRQQYLTDKQRQNEAQQQFLKDKLKQNEAQPWYDKNKQQFLKDRLKQNEAQQKYLKDQEKNKKETQKSVTQKNDFKPAMQAPADNNSPAQFAGGLQEWRRYLERNADLKMLAEHKAPEGKYKVTVAFTVRTDGSLSDIAAETNTGYGTEEAVIKAIGQGRKWQPGKKDGAFIETQVKQTLTFTMVKERWSYVEINSITVGNVQTNYVNSPL